MSSDRLSSARNQRGIATILIVLMVGLAVSVTVAATVYSLRGTQQRQLTTHSLTAAQATAWRGVEALRLYLLQVDKAVWPSWVGNDIKPVAGLGALGVSSAQLTSIEASGSNQYRITAQITGEAGVGSARTTATVEVVYNLMPGSGAGTGSPAVCHSSPNAPLVFNGNLDYSGGKLDVVNSVNYENVVVAGDLTIGGGASARISGCAKGNINLSGGGIRENGHLFSEGDISIRSMTPPSGTTLWGRRITLDGSSSGARYEALKAGAYSVSLVAGGSVLGTANIGGQLIPATVSGGIPWTRGTVSPMVTSNPILVTLIDGSQHLLDLSKAVVDPSSGQVSGAQAASTAISGEAVMPDHFGFRSDAIHGGDLSAQGLARTRQVWGHAVVVGLNNGGLTGGIDVGQLLVNGNLEIGTGNVDAMVGGGSIWARGAGRSGPSNYWNFPRIGAGTIADKVYYSSGRTLLPAGEERAALGVQANSVGASPGLPGVPWCDARVKAVDADSYKGAANYLFESVGGQPQLTIQNVKRADGSVINGIYPLQNPSAAQLAVLQELMICSYGNDKGCRQIRQADGSWQLGGIRRMPAGVLWFDSRVTVNGSDVDLINTLINKGGDVALTSSGHKDLLAPNFAGAARTCGGDFYPSNLCASRTALVTWEGADASGSTVTYTGLPIANTAVISEQGASMSGWTIRGSVLLGRQLSTSGAQVTIQGSLTVGSNQRSDTTISAGGIMVEVPSGAGLNLLPVCGLGTPDLPGAPSSAVVHWSRYL